MSSLEGQDGEVLGRPEGLMTERSCVGASRSGMSRHKTMPGGNRRTMDRTLPSPCLGPAPLFPCFRLGVSFIFLGILQGLLFVFYSSSQGTDTNHYTLSGTIATTFAFAVRADTPPPPLQLCHPPALRGSPLPHVIEAHATADTDEKASTIRKKSTRQVIIPIMPDTWHLSLS